MSTVPNRTGLLEKMWSLIQIHPGKLQDSSHRGKRGKCYFLPTDYDKKQAQKISSVMDQDLHDCVLFRQSRVATCSI